MYQKIWLLIGMTILLILITRGYPTRRIDVAENDPNHMKLYKRSTINFNTMVLLILSLYSIFMFVIYRLGRMARTAIKMLSSGMIAALLLSLSLVENIKKIVGRPRPDFFDRIKLDGNGKYIRSAYIIEDGRKSFPSGHTSTAFCAALFLVYTASLYFRKRSNLILFSLLSLIIAASVGYTRIYDNRHFLSDVCVGAIIGMVCSVLISSIMNQNKKDWI